MSSVTVSLRRMGRTPPVDLVLPLGQGKTLHIAQWLRILPGKRLVGRGIWQGQPVLAKLFIAPGAERHWQRECKGILALQCAGLPTPGLLASGELPGGGYYLLTTFLEGAQTLLQCWEQLANPSSDHPVALDIMRQALSTIAAMHCAGLMQTDLHLGNFLRHEQKIYVIDGDAIEVQEPGKPLPLASVQANLGLLFAQLPPQWDARVAEWLEYYQARVSASSLMTGHDAGASSLQYSLLLAEIRVQRQVRMNCFLPKTLRDCSQFAVTRSAGCYSVVQRSEQQALAALLADPDRFFIDPPLLKDGGSSTVARITVGARDVVIKRYNIKSLSHWLRRFWRPSRAWHSWLSGWRLHFLGIATPQPLAMVERRIGPLRREAWLITEYCAGYNLLELFGESGDTLPDEEAAAALLHGFNQLAEARISHGDFKATNLLWHEGQIQLIDLDAMQVHRSRASWHRAWVRDRSRFIRNWPADSRLAKWLDELLPR